MTKQELLLWFLRAWGVGRADVPLPVEAGASMAEPGFIELVRNHRCSALVLDASAHLPRPMLPDEVVEHLRHDAYVTTVRALHLCRKHASVIQSLKEQEIESLAIKGPAIGQLAYGNVGLRGFDDLDIIVHSPDFSRARAIIVAQGYHPQFEAPVRAYTWGGWDCFMTAQDRTHGVELSVSAMPRYFFHLPESVIWENTSEVHVEGVSLPVLSDEVHFILLCVHGAKHSWNRAAWIADIAGMIVRRDHMNWDHVRRLAHRHGAARMVRVALILASEVCGVAIPPDMQGDVESDWDAPLLAEKFLNMFLAGEGREPSKGTAMGLHLRLKERWRDKVLYVARLALTPGYSDWHARTLPDCLYPIYYVTRPFRLIATQCRKLRPQI